MAVTHPTPLPDSLDARAARAPQQERGQRRVEQILDAAEAVFAETGVDGASMQAIADRAESSVGSLYHFFPNKEAVIEALGIRYAERVRLVNEQAMPLEMAHIEPEVLFERVLSSQMAFIERTPAFPAMQDAIHRNCPAVKEALNNALVGHVGKFLALRYPRMAPEMRAVSALVSVQTVHALMQLACMVPVEYRPAVVDEAKRMLVRHYAAYDAQQ
ncbi:MAG: TetR/AcrR family transcriptional regulator [Gemmatimonadetes bacterium]|jgi:AcrR family transcriptional regulator|nr:TetR/AcrR family transcriptional regulator [Gemmatimonadota bacterium]MBP7548818.1 TetR/AcrR family transcriptional regulator [Gemmatimonadaceae bacterium]